MAYNENYCFNWINIIHFSTIQNFSGRDNIKTSKKNQNETTIDLEKDPKTKEYKPKE